MNDEVKTLKADIEAHRCAIVELDALQDYVLYRYDILKKSLDVHKRQLEEVENDLQKK